MSAPKPAPLSLWKAFSGCPQATAKADVSGGSFSFRRGQLHVYCYTHSSTACTRAGFLGEVTTAAGDFRIVNPTVSRVGRHAGPEESRPKRGNRRPRL